MEDTMNEIHRHLIKLDDPNKVERKKNLQSISDILHKKFPLPSNSDKLRLNDREVCLIWTEKLHAPLLRGLRDDSERVRELSAEIILFFFYHMANSSPMTLSYTLPVLKQRLAHLPEEEAAEPSEEVRLILLKILTRILQLSGPESSQDLKGFLDDLVKILSSCILDNFADIKELACDDVHLLAKSLPNDFHFTAQNLLNPLAKAMTHQQKKVRVATIKAVGTVIHHSGFDEFQLIASHFAQRLFDPVPQVRLAVSRIAGDLLLGWKNAYSTCSLLIPLILTSLEDDTTSTQEEIWELWSQVGIKWVKDEASRDDRLKEQMDFQGAAPPPDHYPIDIKRPNFGCRKYITKIIYKLLPALKNDLVDWLAETRIKTSQLTYLLICHMEETSVITQHADALISLFFTGIKDSEVTVAKNMCRAARIYGYFVPPRTWAPLVNQRLTSQATSTDLLIISHIIKGSDPVLFKHCLEDMAITLQDDSVCLTANDDFLQSLLECIFAMVTICGHDCACISSHLFKIGVTVDGLSMNPQIQDSADNFMEKMADAMKISKNQLFRNELGPALKSMKLECEDWTANSFRVSVFAKLLFRAGPEVGHYPDLIVSIFHEVLNKEVEPELQLKMFLTLSKQLYDLKNTLDSQNEFKQLALKIITELILPALKWRAGRKAEAVRIAATSSLWGVFASGAIDPKEVWSTNLASKLIPAMNRLLEDDAIKTRLFVCKAMKFLFEQSSTLIPMEYLAKMCTELMKRLDDVNDDVRLACLDAMQAVSQCLPHETSAELEQQMSVVFSSILLHMDDSNSAVRDKALETLEATGTRYPSLLLDLASKAKEKHVHKDHCISLLNYLQRLSV